jgi:hypothetical protein
VGVTTQFFDNSLRILEQAKLHTTFFTLIHMKTHSPFLVLMLFALMFGLNAHAQQSLRESYVEEYAQLSVSEMNRSGIPASITLAQGILESGIGQSELARKSNNHFGIKCHSDWKGAKVYHDDDAKGECFRKYNKPQHSFEDHTDFLMRGSRYAFLFELDPGDYKSWARGLKKAGYATAPDYADRLIKIIEDEMLYRFDDPGSSTPSLTGGKGPVLDKKGRPVTNTRERFVLRRVQNEGTRVAFVRFQKGDRLEYIADSLHLPAAALLQFNDWTHEVIVAEGERVYVDEKKGRGATKTTVVRVGETMHDISQREQMKLAKLYKFNDFPVGYQPMVGDEIRLRRLSLLKRVRGK